MASATILNASFELSELDSTSWQDVEGWQGPPGAVVNNGYYAPDCGV